MPPTICNFCHGVLTRKRTPGGPRRYCSTDCKRASDQARWDASNAAKNARRRAATRRARAVRRLAEAATGSRGAFRMVSGRCCRCGDWFTHQQVGPDAARFCTRRCRYADKRDRYRARSFGATIGPAWRFRVHERDGWICQLCGDPTDRSAKVPALGAPVIDHRTPLVLGGAHDERNWQTAHFYCNSVKGGREWPALVAA